MNKKHELIKINNNKYVIVDEEAGIKEGDTVYQWISESIIEKIDFGVMDSWKIIATINHKLEGIPEIVVENEVEKLADDYSMKERKSKWGDIVRNAFNAGYKAAQQKYYFTEEDLRELLLECWNTARSDLFVGFPKTSNNKTWNIFTKIIQSLKQPKEIESVELEYEELGGDNKTNSFGKKQIYYQQLKIHNKELNQIKPVKINYK